MEKYLLRYVASTTHYFFFMSRPLLEDNVLSRNFRPQGPQTIQSMHRRSIRDISAAMHSVYSMSSRDSPRAQCPFVMRGAILSLLCHHEVTAAARHSRVFCCLSISRPFITLSLSHSDWRSPHTQGFFKHSHLLPRVSVQLIRRRILLLAVFNF
jgi:hypothetical protein